jgi:hypothetical protein
MSDRETFLEALEPVLAAVAGLDPADPEAAARLSAAFPLEGPALTRLRTLMRAGVEAGWLCDREAGGVRFSRVKKAEAGGLSVDAVHMSAPGPGHLHPNGEFDLCFAVSGAPTFDGRAPGWTVYPPGSWHVPTVAGGVMDILYFLPEGAIEFGPKPPTKSQM